MIRVIRFDTGELLNGKPSEALAARTKEREPIRAVYNDGEWLIADDQSKRSPHPLIYVAEHP